MTFRTTTALLLVLPGLACAQSGDPVSEGAENAEFEPAFAEQTEAPAQQSVEVEMETLADGLEHPWGIAPMPEGGYLVTERSGALRRLSAEGELSEPIAGVPEVDNRRQGGLLDVNVPEDFAESREVFIAYAKSVEGGTVTAAAKGVLSEDGTELTDVSDIFVQQPPADTPAHYGSRIVFEPGTDNVFITTGEHFTQANRQLAQDLGTTYGKVVRVTRDGEAPEDNPFVGHDGEDVIWSYGHRNIQGAAIHPETGELWTIEHGPAGGDELNRPEAGLNYGWPVVSYGTRYNGSPVGSGEARQEGMEGPVYYWDPVIAPGGMIWYEGDMFTDWQGDLLIGGLVAGAVVRLDVAGERVTGEERIAEGIGRVRDVEEAPDGSVLVLIDAAAPDGAVMRLTPAE